MPPLVSHTFSLSNWRQLAREEWSRGNTSDDFLHLFTETILPPVDRNDKVQEILHHLRNSSIKLLIRDGGMLSIRTRHPLFDLNYTQSESCYVIAESS